MYISISPHICISLGKEEKKNSTEQNKHFTILNNSGAIHVCSNISNNCISLRFSL
jgi:hypothetical protein